MNRSYPRLVIAALRGGAGKTTLSVAIIAALRQQGIAVAPFKKGPDYIDAAWLGKAGSGPCYNLDTYLMGADQVARSFARHAAHDGVSIIEGNRGLYDGVTSAGEYSTAELAKLLAAPVILVVDCDKVTRTAAAMVLGCLHFDPAVNLQGVILSKASGTRHASVIRRSIEETTGLTVYGVVPRLPDLPFVQRHLGLIPPEEHDHVRQALKQAGSIALDYLDLPGLLQAAKNAPAWTIDAFPAPARRSRQGEAPVTIGILKDAAFQFYYQDNIEALTDRGAKVIEISALADRELPAGLDALYIGGGFPETQAAGLAANVSFRQSLKSAAEGGLPIYAECGGFIYLGESLIVGQSEYPMVGSLPVTFGLEKKPQGHGYTALAVDAENPFFPVGQTLIGHEFHYCRILSQDDYDTRTACYVLRGAGIGNRREGMCKKNILAGFTHLHALGTPGWAGAMMDAARTYCRMNINNAPGISAGRITIQPEEGSHD